MISFAVTQSGPVSLRIYDVVGREVAVLVNGTLSAGRYHAEWNAAGLSSGVYFYQLRAGAFVSSRKMLLQK